MESYNLTNEEQQQQKQQQQDEGLLKQQNEKLKCENSFKDLKEYTIEPTVVEYILCNDNNFKQQQKQNFQQQQQYNYDDLLGPPLHNTNHQVPENQQEINEINQNLFTPPTYDSLPFLDSKTTNISFSRQRRNSLPFISNDENVCWRIQRDVEEERGRRAREKGDMRNLNERFAGYIEKVRFLESQNKKLAKELNDLMTKWGRETKIIKIIYEEKLNEIKKNLEEIEKQRDKAEVKAASMEEEKNDFLERLKEITYFLNEERRSNNLLLEKISELETKNFFLEKKLKFEMETKKKMEIEMEKMKNLIAGLRNDLDNETLLHIDTGNRLKTSEEEMDFLKIIHEQEIREILELIGRDDTMEKRSFWKNEINKCVEELRNLFGNQLDSIVREMEERYLMELGEQKNEADRLKVEKEKNEEKMDRTKERIKEINEKMKDSDYKNSILIKEIENLRKEKEFLGNEKETEVIELRQENICLRSEMEGILKELEKLTDENLEVKLEVEAYKKLIEENESRNEEKIDHHSQIKTEKIKNNQLENPNFNKNKLNDSEQHQQQQQNNDFCSKTKITLNGNKTKEMTSKVTTNKTSNGPISVMESSEDGFYVVIGNHGNRVENLEGWVVEREADGKYPVIFNFEVTDSLNPGDHYKIWSRISNKKNNELKTNEKIINNEKWPTGQKVITNLLNPSQEIKSTIIQTTNYS